MAKGHANIAAIGTEKLNAQWGTNFQSSYKKGDVHAQIEVLKQNLRDYYALYQSNSQNWKGVPSLDGNTTTTFDADTETVLKKFQSLEGLTSDGIYGAASRNRMAAKVGVSPNGWVRIESPSKGNYYNYNDTNTGLIGDSEYKLDHSWVTISTRNTIASLANTFYDKTSKKLEINDCSLIDGSCSPEHSSHMGGKDADIRNAGLTISQQKAFLQACIDNTNVQRVLYFTKHGFSNSKIVVESNHNDHFHVDFVN